MLALALATSACTFGIRENTRNLTATGPEGGWTVLAFQQTAPRLPAIEVTGTSESVPTASASLTFLDPLEGSLSASDEALAGASLSFGEPVAREAEVALPLTLSMPASAEELPSVRNLHLGVPYALGLAVDVRDTRVNVSGVEGPVSVTTSNAEVGVSTFGEHLTVTTSNAPVSGVVGGGKVTTSAGEVNLEWTGAGDLDVSNANGAVTITVSPDAGVSFILATTNGTITVFRETYPSPYTGVRNENRKLLFVANTNGDITIR